MFVLLQELLDAFHQFLFILLLEVLLFRCDDDLEVDLVGQTSDLCLQNEVFTDGKLSVGSAAGYHFEGLTYQLGFFKLN